MSTSYLPQTTKAPTALGRYRLLSPLASIRVSPLQLGAVPNRTGNSVADRESNFELLDAYYNAGGNFIDTARSQQGYLSEEIIGEWMEMRGIRDQLVISTKYSSLWNPSDSLLKQKISFVGNGTKNQRLSLEASLQALRTTYIDLYYVHWYDWDASIEELMNSLHSLIVAGKVLHLGISAAPAWIVSRANQYAHDHSLTPFCIYRGQWDLTKRSFERDIIPMARTLGLALAPWDVLASGTLQTLATDTSENNEDIRARTLTSALQKVAQEVGATSIQAVTIAYHLQKTPYVFPIIGGPTIQHLEKSIEALEIPLSKDQIAYLEAALPFDVGFPNWLIGDGTFMHPVINACAAVDKWPVAEAIKPAR